MADYSSYYQANKPLDVEHYFRLVVRQKWFILVPALLGLSVAALISLLLENQYSARATILVERASLPTEFLRPTLPYGPESYVRSLVEQIKSTSSLEKIIKEFNLYPEMRQRKSIEEVVAYMRARVIIENKANDTFSVQFQGESPDVVAKVTNRLTDMFIEENLRYRLARSTENVAFLEKESQRLRAQVSEQERQIQEFKSANIDRLPEQRNSTQLQLSSAQQRLQTISESIVSARNRVQSAQDRGALMREMLQNEPATATAVVLSPRETLEADIRKNQLELSGLMTQFSEKHPDVRRKQKELEMLQARLASLPSSGGKRARSAGRSPELLRAQEEERLALSEVERLEAERGRLESLVTALSARLEDTPRVALALQQLEQGLEVKREQADSFQKKATEAAASLELERQNQGSQFRALDRAQVPTRPDSPNRPFIALMGAGLGIALGIALVIGMDLLFRPFLDDKDLFRFAKVPVLISIPHHGPFPSDLMRLRRQLANLLSLLLGSLPGGARLTYAGASLRVPPRAQYPSLPDAPSPEGLGEAPAAARFSYLTGETLSIRPEVVTEVLLQTPGQPTAGADSSTRAQPLHAPLHRPRAELALRSGQEGRQVYAQPRIQELAPYTGPLASPGVDIRRVREIPAHPSLEAEAALLESAVVSAPALPQPDGGAGASNRSAQHGLAPGLAALRPQPTDMLGSGGVPAQDLARLTVASREDASRTRAPDANTKAQPGPTEPMPGFGPVPTSFRQLGRQTAQALLFPEEASSALPVLTPKSSTLEPSERAGTAATEREVNRVSAEADAVSDVRLELPQGWGIPKNWVVEPLWPFTGKEDARSVTDGIAPLRELELAPPWQDVTHYARPVAETRERS